MPKKALAGAFGLRGEFSAPSVGAPVCGLTLRTGLFDNAPTLTSVHERAYSMYKVVALALAAATAVMVSGCAVIGTHSAPIEGGRKTTFGLLAIESMGDGYPMIPLYTNFELGKK